MVASESSGLGLLFLLYSLSLGKVRIICLTTLLALLFTSESFASDFPLLVGGHDHGAANIHVLHDLGIGNFIWIPKHNVPEDGNTPWDEEHDIFAAVDACVKNKMYFMISQGRGLGFHIRPGSPEYGGDGNRTTQRPTCETHTQAVSLKNWLTTFSFLEIDRDSFSGPKVPICAQNLGVMPFNLDSELEYGNRKLSKLVFCPDIWP